MISALLYLQWHSWRNRLRARLRRLKNPKYLVGAVIGALYLGFYLVWLPLSQGSASRPAGLPTPDPALAENLGALLLTAAAILFGWVLPNDRVVLAFTETEVNFLFPAPVTRRQLIHFKLLRRQIAILFSVFFLTLVWGRWRYGGHVWVSAVGWWVILSFLDLHSLAASFLRSMLMDRGIVKLRLRIIILALVAGAAAVIYVTNRDQWPPLAPGADFDERLNWFKQVLSTGTTPYLLAPFRMIVRPYLAHDAGTFLVAFAIAAAILLAHYFFIISVNVAFEDAAVEYSQKLAARISAMQERRVPGGVTPTKPRRAPFKLKPTGLPSVAFLWKNLILSGSFFTPGMFIRILIMIAIWSAFIPAGGNTAQFIGVLGFAALFLSVLFGQNMLRIDFRSDLNMAEQLLSYPLPGWQIVLGEILAPAAILAAIQWLIILVLALFAEFGDDPMPLNLRVGFAIAAAIVVPAIDFLMLLIPNAVAVLFPSWVRFDKNAPRGFENFGQNVLIVVVQIVALNITVIPAAIGAAMVVAINHFLLNGAVSPLLVLPCSALVALVILAAEGYAGVRMLGSAFERFDLSSEMTN